MRVMVSNGSNMFIRLDKTQLCLKILEIFSMTVGSKKKSMAILFSRVVFMVKIFMFSGTRKKKHENTEEIRKGQLVGKT